MIIRFYHNSKQENINDINNPIGTLLITFINETDFDTKLINQKDTNFLKAVHLSHYQLFLDDLMEIYNVKTKNEQSKEIQELNISFDDNKTLKLRLSDLEFDQLVLLIIYIKHFIELKINDKDKPLFFMYYFNTFLNYQIPKYKVLNNSVLHDSNKQLLNLHKNIIKDKDKDIEKNETSFYDILITNTLDLLKDLKQSYKSEFITEYECNNTLDILLASLHYIYNNNISIRKCINCDRLFIPNSNSQKCCNNIRPKLESESEESYDTVTETCSQYNSRCQSIKNMSPIDLVKRKVKQRIQKRIREGKESKLYLREWEEDVRKARDSYPDDTKYIKWILEVSDKHQRGGKRTNGSTRNNKK